MFGLAVWLGVGALTALLFGALVSWSRHSWDEDDLERITIVTVRRTVSFLPHRSQVTRMNRDGNARNGSSRASAGVGSG